jgi:hypothetical protein
MPIELCCTGAVGDVVCVATLGIDSAAAAVVIAAGTGSVTAALTIGAGRCSYDEEPCLLCVERDDESSCGDTGVGS